MHSSRMTLAYETGSRTGVKANVSKPKIGKCAYIWQFPSCYSYFLSCHGCHVAWYACITCILAIARCTLIIYWKKSGTFIHCGTILRNGDGELCDPVMVWWICMDMFIYDIKDCHIMLHKKRQNINISYFGQKKNECYAWPGLPYHVITHDGLGFPWWQWSNTRVT